MLPPEALGSLSWPLPAPSALSGPWLWPHHCTLHLRDTSLSLFYPLSNFPLPRGYTERPTRIPEAALHIARSLRGKAPFPHEIHPQGPGARIWGPWELLSIHPCEVVQRPLRLTTVGLAFCSLSHEVRMRELICREEVAGPPPWSAGSKQEARRGSANSAPVNERAALYGPSKAVQDTL